jgi:hypothetical protein
MDEDRNKLIEAWIQNQETFWALEKLDDIVNRSHDDAWPIVIEIAKRTDSEDVLGSLAAGPLEDMLCAFGDHYYDLVRKASEECFNFKRSLLMGIRINGEGSERIKELIQKIGEESIRDGWNPHL